MVLKMKIPKFLTSLLVAVLSLTACHSLPEYENDPEGNFDALWTIIDEHYCFFKEKNVDWRGVYTEFRPKVRPDMTSQELFSLCAEMLDVLEDGHTNLSSSFNTSYYRRWWSDYPQNYNARVIEQYYFNFNYRQAAGLMYGILLDNIGYVRYDSFADGVGEGNLDSVLAYLSTCNGLIIDIRDNGGGSMTNVDKIVARFITERTLMGYISHKTGPGHDSFSDPRPYYIDPAPAGRLMWSKPTVVLTNRSTFSAANNFVSVMQYLPQVKIVGSRTGGGSGMPFSSELPNGWGIRFSACSVLDARGNTTEFGIDPSPGCEVDLDERLVADGHDTMLDFAVDMLCQM